MKKIKILRYGGTALMILGIVCGLCTININVQQVAYGKLDNIVTDSVLRVVVDGSQFGINKLCYYNDPHKSLAQNDLVTIAFMQGKREIVFGYHTGKSLWWIVYLQRLEYLFLLVFFAVLLFGVICLRYNYANSFYMNMGLWRNRNEKFRDPQLTH